MTRWFGELQCFGHAQHRFVSWGFVNAAFEVAQAPDAEPRQLCQLLLREAGVHAVLPEQSPNEGWRWATLRLKADPAAHHLSNPQE
jgi:hypothetical protein